MGLLAGVATLEVANMGNVSTPLPTADRTAVAWSVNVRVIEQARILRGWKPVRLAQAAHMDPRTVRSLVAGRRRPNLGSVQAFCTALTLSLADVIVFDGQRSA